MNVSERNLEKTLTRICTSKYVQKWKQYTHLESIMSPEGDITYCKYPLFQRSLQR